MNVKKVMVIRAYGHKWDYNLYMVQDKVAEKAEELMEKGEWAKAYEFVRDKDRTRDVYTKRKDWYDLNTVDLLLEYIEGVTI